MSANVISIVSNVHDKMLHAVKWVLATIAMVGNGFLVEYISLCFGGVTSQSCTAVISFLPC